MLISRNLASAKADYADHAADVPSQRLKVKVKSIVKSRLTGHQYDKSGSHSWMAGFAMRAQAHKKEGKSFISTAISNINCCLQRPVTNQETFELVICNQPGLWDTDGPDC